MFDWVFSPEAWIALATLTTLEIVLGIDNIVVISILVGRLPAAQRHRARVFGLALAMISRIALLLTLTWMMRLTDSLFQIMGQDISGRDIILIGGGLFLMAKTTMEIHNTFADHRESDRDIRVGTFASIIIQIALIDIVFSLDSVITAVGMANDILVMVIAVVIAVLIMMIASKPIGEFTDSNPTVKMLALSFLILIGVALIGEGLDMHISKGYIYFAMAFSCCVEMLNIRLRKYMS
ncbi:MAG: TerC family protein [candidate division Zixibacteria bacterium]|nr:TerC family protein [candidate division Zixibacteria bacterium]